MLARDNHVLPTDAALGVLDSQLAAATKELRELVGEETSDA